jgi:hypothetical protein
MQMVCLRTFTVVFCLALIATAPFPLKSGSPLVGDWSVTLISDGQAQGADDVLTFTLDSQFTSQMLAKHGFGPAAYQEDIRAFGPAQFTVTATSNTEGKAQWTGAVTASAIEGSLTWTKKDGTVLNFTFKGSKKSDR